MVPAPNTTPSYPINVALVQEPPVFLNLRASIERAASLIADAANRGAQLIAFGETWLPGYPVWLDESPAAALWNHPPAKALFGTLFDNSLAIPSPEFDRLRNAAREAQAFVVIGAHEQRGGTLYNTILYFAPNGELVHLHRKLVPTYTERLIWGRGDGSTLAVFDSPLGRIGGLVCWEHWMPLLRAAMHAKNELIHVAQWPAVKELHMIASRHYAFEGQCFALAAGSILSKGDVLDGFHSLELGTHPGRELLEAIPGESGRLLMNGGSAVIAPSTEFLAGPLCDQPGILQADLHPELATQGRLTIDTDGHYSRPDIFRLEVDERERRNVVWRERCEKNGGGVRF